MKKLDRAVELERMLDVVIDRVRLCLAAERRFAHGAEDNREQRWNEMEEASRNLRLAIRTALRGAPTTAHTGQNASPETEREHG